MQSPKHFKNKNKPTKLNIKQRPEEKHTVHPKMKNTNHSKVTLPFKL